MSRKTILMATTLLAITLALSMVVASAQAQDPVYEVKLRLLTKRGTPLAGAQVQLPNLASETVALDAANVYELKVSVVGSAGQLLDGAAVAVLKDGYVVASATARGGVATFELLPGDYTIEAAFLGKRGTAKVSMTTDYSISIPLDVFMVIGNQAFSASEIVLWIVLAIVIVIVLARMRRKAPAPPTPPPTEAPAKTQ